MSILLFRHRTIQLIPKLSNLSTILNRRLPSARCHSTHLLAKTLSNSNNRLRVGEERYADDYSTPFPTIIENVFSDINEETEETFNNAHMMISSNQAKLLRALVKLLRPQRILEIGGFTGSSAIAMGSGLSSEGTLLSLEMDPKPLAVARKYIKLAHLEDKVQIKEGPALESLQELAQLPHKPQFNMIFIDADKGGYISYFDFVIDNNLLSDDGFILVDNVLFFGHVHREAGYEGKYPEEVSKNIKKTAIKVHKFNKHVLSDPRVEVVMLPIYDGITIIRKK
ncbi:O-methyltransferase-domain-containing protein [Pilobolus umbonatus]|nr:O-methyltransferase-domain-containing protein [Pilobolus umbonatus]